LKGSLLKAVSAAPLPLDTPTPAFAEKASSEAHSEWVMYNLSVPIQTSGQHLILSEQYQVKASGRLDLRSSSCAKSEEKVAKTVRY